jgi:hypothetical protein
LRNAGKIRTANEIINISEVLGADDCGRPVNPWSAGSFQIPFDRILPVERLAELFPLTEAPQISATLYPHSSAYARGLWT